jgi:flagellar basal body-associated protein FliL
LHWPYSGSLSRFGLGTHAEGGTGMTGIIPIIIVVLIVLFVLGYFGRGRFRA